MVIERSNWTGTAELAACIQEHMSPGVHINRRQCTCCSITDLAQYPYNSVAHMTAFSA